MDRETLVERGTIFHAAATAIAADVDLKKLGFDRSRSLLADAANLFVVAHAIGNEDYVSRLTEFAERFLRDGPMIQEYLENSKPTANGLARNTTDLMAEMLSQAAALRARR